MDSSIVVSIISTAGIVLAAVMPIVISNKNEIRESMKCSLRNDILSIYDGCKNSRIITMYQLQALNYSYDQYKKLGGNSFVDEIKKLVDTFEVKD